MVDTYGVCKWLPGNTQKKGDTCIYLQFGFDTEMRKGYTTKGLLYKYVYY